MDQEDKSKKSRGPLTGKAKKWAYGLGLGVATFAGARFAPQLTEDHDTPEEHAISLGEDIVKGYTSFKNGNFFFKSLLVLDLIILTTCETENLGGITTST